MCESDQHEAVGEDDEEEARLVVAVVDEVVRHLPRTSGPCVCVWVVVAMVVKWRRVRYLAEHVRGGQQAQGAARVLAVAAGVARVPAEEAEGCVGVQLLSVLGAM